MSGKTVEGLFALFTKLCEVSNRWADEPSHPVTVPAKEAYAEFRTYAAALAAPQEQPAPSVHQLCRLWFDEWELILPPDARESFRNDLLPSVGAAGVLGTYKPVTGDAQ